MPFPNLTYVIEQCISRQLPDITQGEDTVDMLLFTEDRP